MCFWWGFGVGSFHANPGVRFPSIILKMIDDKHGKTSDCIYQDKKNPMLRMSVLCGMISAEKLAKMTRKIILDLKEARLLNISF